jgi:hypothetical protein
MQTACHQSIQELTACACCVFPGWSGVGCKFLPLQATHCLLCSQLQLVTFLIVRDTNCSGGHSTGIAAFCSLCALTCVYLSPPGTGARFIQSGFLFFSCITTQVLSLTTVSQVADPTPHNPQMVDFAHASPLLNRTFHPGASTEYWLTSLAIRKSLKLGPGEEDSAILRHKT